MNWRWCLPSCVMMTFWPHSHPLTVHLCTLFSSLESLFLLTDLAKPSATLSPLVGDLGWLHSPFPACTIPMPSSTHTTPRTDLLSWPVLLGRIIHQALTAGPCPAHWLVHSLGKVSFLVAFHPPIVERSFTESETRGRMGNAPSRFTASCQLTLQTRHPRLACPPLTGGSWGHSGKMVFWTARRWFVRFQEAYFRIVVLSYFLI